MPCEEHQSSKKGDCLCCFMCRLCIPTPTCKSPGNHITVGKMGRKKKEVVVEDGLEKKKRKRKSKNQQKNIRNAASIAAQRLKDISFESETSLFSSDGQLMDTSTYLDILCPSDTIPSNGSKKKSSNDI